MPSARPLAVVAFLAAVLGTTAGVSDADAQQIYRSIGADGRVTFSDKQPVDLTSRPSSSLPVASNGGGGNGASSLPFELRQVANRYPVILYTGVNCEPCGAGRTFLIARGIPFTEKSVTTSEDIDAFQRMSGANALPLVTVGGQQLRGFAEGEWPRFLDAAAYPKTSQLPAGYRPLPATPLVVAQQPAPASARTFPKELPAAALPQPQSAEPAEAAGNPTGIRF